MNTVKNKSFSYSVMEDGHFCHWVCIESWESFLSLLNRGMLQFIVGILCINLQEECLGNIVNRKNTCQNYYPYYLPVNILNSLIQKKSVIFKP